MFLVIGPDNRAYGPFTDYGACYKRATSRWSGFSVYEVRSVCPTCGKTEK